MPLRSVPLALSLFLAIAPFACAAKRPPKDPLSADSIRAIPVNRYDFESAEPADPTLAPEELSGIVWIDGDRYLAVGDAHAAVHPMTIRVDPRTGQVRSARFEPPIGLRDRSGSPLPEPAMAEDREGITYDPARREIWIANEQTGTDKRWPSIERHTMDGTSVGLLRADSDPSLEPFLHARPNRSFESLSRAPDGSAYWTANEDALDVDGPSATDSTGALVRLVKLSPDLRPLAQFAYSLDPWSGRIRNPALVAGREISGVSEIAALTGTRMLVLERSFGGDIGGNASLRSRLYLVDVAQATDLAAPEFRSGIDGKRLTPARKTLLWQSGWGLTDSNFEGMTLGPALQDGSRLLVLVADNNGGSPQALFTLRLVAR